MIKKIVREYDKTLPLEKTFREDDDGNNIYREIPPIRRSVTETRKYRMWSEPKLVKTEEKFEYFYDGYWQPMPTEWKFVNI